MSYAKQISSTWQVAASNRAAKGTQDKDAKETAWEVFFGGGREGERREAQLQAHSCT